MMGASAPGSRAEVRSFVAAHRCDVIERLERIHASGDRSTSRDRYLAISLMRGGRPESYVQCIFFEKDTKMYCEASSGFYDHRPEERRLRPGHASTTALAALGFSTDGSAGNHHREIDLGAPPNLGAAADLLLTTLHDAYDARPWSELAYNAPFAPTLPPQLHGSRCLR